MNYSYLCARLSDKAAYFFVINRASRSEDDNYRVSATVSLSVVLILSLITISIILVVIAAALSYLKKVSLPAPAHRR